MLNGKANHVLVILAGQGPSPAVNIIMLTPLCGNEILQGLLGNGFPVRPAPLPVELLQQPNQLLVFQKPFRPVAFTPVVDLIGKLP